MTCWSVPWILVFLITFYAPIAASEKIIMGVGDWPPLVSMDLPHQGVLPRIVTEAFAIEGVDVEYRWAPWRRAYENVKTGVWNSTPGWSKSVQRAAEVNFSDPVFESYQVFFHLKSYPFDWESIADLKNIQIGATIGYFYGKDFLQAEKTGLLDVERGASDEINLNKLVYGRIQLFPINILTGYEIAKTSLSAEEFSQITHHPGKLHEPNTYHVIFNKSEKNTHLMQLFNQGLAKMKADGKLERYLLEVYPPTSAP